MANKKISELPAADALTGPETREIVQAGINKKATEDQTKAFILGQLAFGPILYGGHVSVTPTAEKAGTLFISDGIVADGVPEGAWIISKQDNATTISHYDILI